METRSVQFEIQTSIQILGSILSLNEDAIIVHVTLAHWLNT